MNVQIINKSKHPLPAYATELTAGILVNLSSETFVIEDGERIAQMVIARHEQATWQEVEVLDDTERGAGGFGHTGKS